MSQVDRIVKFSKIIKIVKIVKVVKIVKLGVDDPTLASFWKSEGRVHLEANCPVWAGAITQRQSRCLSRVQKKAVATITGKEYKQGCNDLKLEIIVP